MEEKKVSRNDRETGKKTNVARHAQVHVPHVAVLGRNQTLFHCVLITFEVL